MFTQVAIQSNKHKTSPALDGLIPLPKITNNLPRLIGFLWGIEWMLSQNLNNVLHDDTLAVLPNFGSLINGNFWMDIDGIWFGHDVCLIPLSMDYTELENRTLTRKTRLTINGNN